MRVEPCINLFCGSVGSEKSGCGLQLKQDEQSILFEKCRDLKKSSSSIQVRFDMLRPHLLGSFQSQHSHKRDLCIKVYLFLVSSFSGMPLGSQSTDKREDDRCIQYVVEGHLASTIKPAIKTLVGCQDQTVECINIAYLSLYNQLQ